MIDFWRSLGQTARVMLVAGFILLAGVVAVSAWWAFRVDYQVLFADLKPQDALAMTSELDKQKIAYRLGDGGSTILVDKSLVHATRIKLMGKEIPLQGAVGFELFNNTDFGMTEFAQKINYQRALQGELTRTILSLAEISDVRVHLALPEQGLFKQASSRPKAAITLTLKQGQALRPEQVFGIQHLVAAATPGMTPADVTVVNHQGIALSKLVNDEAAVGGANGSGRLDLKKETEDYLVHKAALVLDQTFGRGQALASVDVILNMDQIRTTTEDVIGAPSKDSRAMTGVVVRERESSRDSGPAPLDARAGVTASGSLQREVEYQVGRRVEQVVGQPGSVRRIQVVAVVRTQLDSVQEEQIRKMLSAAVGASTERGDTVVIQSMNAAANEDVASKPAATPDASVTSAEAISAVKVREAPQLLFASILAWLIGGLIVLGLFVVAYRGRAVGRPAMSASDREAALRQIRAWMQQDAASPEFNP